jgi:hypothetical protein
MSTVLVMAVLPEVGWLVVEIVPWTSSFLLSWVARESHSFQDLYSTGKGGKVYLGPLHVWNFYGQTQICNPH